MPEGSSSENRVPMVSPICYQISPSKEFNFSKPTEWIVWIRRFKQFRSAFRLSKSLRDEGSQVNTLPYSITGSRNYDILATFGLTTETFDGYVEKRRNIIFESAKFTCTSPVKILNCI